MSAGFRCDCGQYPGSTHAINCAFRGKVREEHCRVPTKSVGMNQGEYQTALRDFLEDVELEVMGARKKFPSNELQLAAKQEEDGELANALIEHHRGKAKPIDVYTEAVQSAAMAARVCLEGDPQFPTYKFVRGTTELFKPTGSK